MGVSKAWMLEEVAVGEGLEETNSVADRLNSLATDVSAIPTTDLSSEINKIDSAAVDGLLGTEDSLAYDVQEIEYHFHNRGYWYGKDPGDTFLLENGMVPWQCVAGAGDAYGNWVQLSNGDEIVAGVKYDPHKILVTVTSVQGKLYYLQLGTGAGGAQTVLTTIAVYPAATLRQSSIEFRCPRVDNDTLLWARCACDTDAGTIDFVIGLHVYPG